MPLFSNYVHVPKSHYIWYILNIVNDEMKCHNRVQKNVHSSKEQGVGIGNCITVFQMYLVEVIRIASEDCAREGYGLLSIVS